MIKLTELNGLDNEEFTIMLGEIFEHSPWVASKTAPYRPFPSVEALHQTMTEIVSNTTEEEKLELIRAHPNLGDRIEMSDDSTKEQQGAGLQNLTEEEYKSFYSLNQAYMNKFGFPFIFAVKGKTKEDIHEALKRRIENSKTDEFKTALSEIYKIAAFRLQDKITE